MDALEKSFDEAFETMVTQEYYLRCFEDVFDEIVSPEVEGLYRYKSNKSQTLWLCDLL